MAKNVILWTVLLTFIHVSKLNADIYTIPFFSELDRITNEENLLITTVSINSTPIEGQLFILQFDGVMLIPVQSLLSALKFNINTNPETNEAKGWFGLKKNDFVLSNSKVSIRGDLEVRNKNCYLYNDGIDMYATGECIYSWFNIEPKLNSKKLNIDFISSEVIPAYSEIIRKQNRKLRASKNNSYKGAVAENTYRVVTPPIIDIKVSNSFDHRNVSNTNLYINSSLDLFWMETRLGYSANNDGNTGAITLKRSPPKPNKRVAIGIDNIEIGDVYSDPLELVSNGSSGTGFKISRSSLKPGGNFENRTIEGYGNPGWEVELYSNGSLINYGVISDDGRYIFRNIDVSYGVNIFELKFYGPSGQFISKKERFNIEDDMVRKGDIGWSISQVSEGENLIGGEQSRIDTILNTTVSANVGVNSKLSIKATHSNRKSQEEETSFNLIEFSSSILGTSVITKIVEDNSSGKAIKVQTNSKIWEYSLRTDNSSSSIKHANITANSETNKIRLNGNFGFIDRSVNHIFHIKQTKNTLTKISEDEIFNSLNLSIGSGHLSTSSSLVKTTLEDYMSGEIRYSNSINFNSNYRISTRYSNSSNSPIKSLFMQYNRRPDIKSTLTISSSFNIEPDKLKTLSIGYSKNFKYAKLDFFISTNEIGDLTANTGLEFSIDPMARNKMSNTIKSNSGRISLQSFMDSNNNNEFDEDDYPIEGAKFTGPKSIKNMASDYNGFLIASSHSGYAHTDIGLIQSSIYDPYWSSNSNNIRVYNHPGGVQEVNFPIIETIEIEGTVFRRTREDKVYRSDVPLILYDQTGEVISSTRSEFDGVFIFSGIPKGEYTVGVDTSYLIKRKLKASSSRVKLTENESLYFVTDIVIERIQ